MTKQIAASIAAGALTGGLAAASGSFPAFMELFAAISAVVGIAAGLYTQKK
jgi:hypothetical protein